MTRSPGSPLLQPITYNLTDSRLAVPKISRFVIACPLVEDLNAASQPAHSADPKHVEEQLGNSCIFHGFGHYYDRRDASWRARLGQRGEGLPCGAVLSGWLSAVPLLRPPVFVVDEGISCYSAEAYRCLPCRALSEGAGAPRKWAVINAPQQQYLVSTSAPSLAKVFPSAKQTAFLLERAESVPESRAANKASHSHK